MRYVALSCFDAEVTWLDRPVTVQAARHLPPPGEERVLLIGDTLAVLAAARAAGAGPAAPHLLLLDSVGPTDLAAADVDAIAAHPAAVLAHAVAAHRDGYLARGLPAERLVHVPAALAFFPLMLPAFAPPVVGWSPATPPRLACGGRVWRDYDTLRVVADELRLPVDVVTDARRVTLGPSPFLHLHDVLPFDGFCRILARSAAALFPLVPNGRNAGQATIVLAMHLGVPLVASDTPAVREYVRPDESGLLVPPAAPRAMAAAVRSLLADRALAERLARAARAAAAGFEALARARLAAALARLEA